ncbi:cbb3-type cytochrome oxidase assembly protein CcoS [Pseudohaliea sp.]|uniref:cbb3-type cytochrome oxidase assembly protein CcoS n=1 Tax=Pseudohaliea sp. TaxID=2740289 RepID=UPI0032ED5152
MDSLYLLIPVALVFVAVAVKLLLWAIDSGQYDDLDKEGWRILADDDKPDDSAGTQRENDDRNPGDDDIGGGHRP